MKPTATNGADEEHGFDVPEASNPLPSPKRAPAPSLDDVQDEVEDQPQNEAPSQDAPAAAAPVPSSADMPLEHRRIMEAKRHMKARLVQLESLMRRYPIVRELVEENERLYAAAAKK